MIRFCCSCENDQQGWCRTHERKLTECDDAFGSTPSAMARGFYNGAWWQVLLRGGTKFPPPASKKVSGLRYTGERVIPESEDVFAHLNYLTHRIEYEAAATVLTKDMLVLDCACGVGYGSDILRRSAGAVIGVDVSDKAIAYAKEKYRAENLAFIASDARSLPFDDASFDTVMSIETVEHFPDADKFIAEIHRVLRPGGLLFMTTPNGEQHPILHDGHHHKHYRKKELSRLIRKKFQHFVIVSNGMNGICWRVIARKWRR